MRELIPFLIVILPYSSSIIVCPVKAKWYVLTDIISVAKRNAVLN